MRIKAKTEHVERTKDKSQLGARAPTLNANDPTATSADSLREGGLVKIELLASISNDRAQVGRGPYLRFGHQCHRSCTIP